jgi:hypothetical protein
LGTGARAGVVADARAVGGTRAGVVSGTRVDTGVSTLAALGTGVGFEALAAGAFLAGVMVAADLAAMLRRF